MAKRLIDDHILTSPSLARVSPAAQDAFHRFILLADDFGCLEADPFVLRGRGWALRPDVLNEQVAGWMTEYAEAGMLLLWTEGGRWFGYLTGWHGPHGQKHRDEYHPEKAKHGSRRRTPRPPEKQHEAALTEFLSHFASRHFPAISRQLPAPAVPVTVTVPVTGSVSNYSCADQNQTDPPGVNPPPEAEPDTEFTSWIRVNYPGLKGSPHEFERVQREANPGIDLLLEAKKARAWEDGNPKKRKRDKRRFLAGWFARAQDRPHLEQVNAHRGVAVPTEIHEFKHRGISVRKFT